MLTGSGDTLSLFLFQESETGSECSRGDAVGLSVWKSARRLYELLLTSSLLCLKEVLTQAVGAPAYHAERQMGVSLKNKETEMRNEWY